jgi:hypothetical protein
VRPPVRGLHALEDMIGTTSSSSMTMATALATGQSRFEKNSSDSTRRSSAGRCGPSSDGITYSPTAGMNTSSSRR